MWDRLTPEARRVMNSALDEAEELGHGYIGDEHVMLGLLGDDDIGLVGTTALMIGVLPGLYLAKLDPASRIGAIVYGALSLLTIVFFWSGAPDIIGAVTAWLGGLTRGRTPVQGAPRVFAIVGLCIAMLNSTANVAWSMLGAFVER